MTQINVYWYVLPLCLAISLVYAASRHESWPRIWRRAAQWFVILLGVLAGITTLLLLLNSQLL